MNQYTKRVKTALDYSEVARLGPIQLKRKYPDAVFLENKATDTQGYMVKVGETLIIAFRGTQQLRDWITDFEAWHTEVPYDNYQSDIRVHSGFIKAYKSVRKKIIQYITDNSVKPAALCGSTVCGVSLCGTINKLEIKKVVVCGHSLGGALATLCAVDVQYNFGHLDIECYPSGNPAVGNKAFAKSYNKRVPKTVRTYLRVDVVPTLPPEWFGKKCQGGYKHTAVGNPIGPQILLIGLKLWFKRHFKTESFAAELTNHSIELYRKFC